MQNFAFITIVFLGIADLAAGNSYLEKKKTISTYFDPPPDTEIQFEVPKEKEDQQAADISSLITVTPPKGKCLIVHENENKPDIFICKKKSIRIPLKSVFEDGTFERTIFLKDDPSGIKLTWNSNIRIGRVVFQGQPWPGSSHAIYMYDCNATFSHDYGRKVIIKTLGRADWRLRLPPVDKPLPQPPPTPNLFLQRPKKHGVRSNALSQKKDETEYYEIKDIYKWETSTRDAYVMRGDGFTSFDSSAKGMDGLCRYKFFGYKYDKKSGALECHNTAEFRWLYVPVTCFHKLGPKTVN